MFRYYINVESQGGADLSFAYISSAALVPNQVIHDDLGRGFVVVAVAENTIPDPIDGSVTLASATARAA
jgi:hypothetical protein